MSIILPILVLGILGLGFGLGLALAAKKFSVASDPKLEAVLSSLPGANCGACGKPGCFGFAESLVKGEADINACAVTEEGPRNKICQLLGLKVQEKAKTVAVLHCNGGDRVQDRFVYDGIPSCSAANMVSGGPKACVYGCLGFGDCVRACPFEAITMTGHNLPKVEREKCRACGRCVQVCPKDLFSLIPQSAHYYTNCSSKDIGKNVLRVCSAGCIGCGKCQRACPCGKAIEVKDNLAVFDYERCTNAGECFRVCPTKAIA
ncbi:MAG: RnfABCDGE type electron transport complex subunit B, partial [Candidatus Omnitrophota bacterium]